SQLEFAAKTLDRVSKAMVYPVGGKPEQGQHQRLKIWNGHWSHLRTAWSTATCKWTRSESPLAPRISAPAATRSVLVEPVSTPYPMALVLGNQLVAGQPSTGPIAVAFCMNVSICQV